MSVTDITGPIGDEGEFFVTYAMIVEAPGTMEELSILLSIRSMSVPGGLMVWAEEQMDGYLIRWKPNPKPLPPQIELHNDRLLPDS